MGKPTFGIFDHIEAIPGTSTRRLFQDRIELVKMADEAGFAGYHVAEHHGLDLCLAPNQEVFLAAAAQATSSIRLGPMVKLLPLHHPIHVLEDLCVLDQLSGGRVEFGVGRGVAPMENAWFGKSWQERHERFEDSLRIICEALATGEASSAGSKVPRLPVDASRHGATAAADAVLVSRQSRHGRSSRDETDVAGADRPGLPPALR